MKKVTKALITAAGLGSRMYPYTKNTNKLMIPIINKPMVHYLVKELVDSGIKEIIISGRYLESVKNYFKKNLKLIEEVKEFGQKDSLRNLNSIPLKCKLIFIEQNKPKGWMYEIYKSRKLLKNSPFAVVMSDILYYYKKPAIGQIIKRYSETKLNIQGVCRYVFTSKFLDQLTKINFEKGDNLNVQSLVLKKILNKGELIHFNIEGEWFDIGTPLGHLRAETFFGLNDKKISKEYKLYLKEILKKLE